MSIRKRRNVLLPLLLFTILQGPVFSAELNQLFTELQSDAAVMHRESGTRVVRERLVKINFDILLGPGDVSKSRNFKVESDMAFGPKARTQNKRIRLNLFADMELFLVLEKVQNYSPDGTTISWFGRVADMPDSEVILVNSEKIMSGNITLEDGRFFQIRFVSDGVHVIREIDRSKFPPEAEPRRITTPLSRIPEQEVQPLVEPEADDNVSSAEDEVPNIIDIMVLYTPAARIAAGGTAAMNTIIDLAVTETNQGYINSQVIQRINLVYRDEIGYTEMSSDVFGNALDALTDQDDGQIDIIHTWRNIYRADIVSMFINGSEYCGKGWVMEDEALSFEEFAFNVVAWDCATGNFSLAHEMGHNQGGQHDIGTTPEDGVFEYSHGYQDPSGSFRTIMAYDCPSGCTRFNFWSNTVVTFGGEALGQPTNADMRRSHNNTYDTVSNWRRRVTTVYVDHAYTGLFTLGTIDYPFNFIDSGVNAITPSTQDGHIWATPGIYDESVIIEKPITFHNWGTGSIIIIGQ